MNEGIYQRHPSKFRESNYFLNLVLTKVAAEVRVGGSGCNLKPKYQKPPCSLPESTEIKNLF